MAWDPKSICFLLGLFFWVYSESFTFLGVKCFTKWNIYILNMIIKKERKKNMMQKSMKFIGWETIKTHLFMHKRNSCSLQVLLRFIWYFVHGCLPCDQRPEQCVDIYIYILTVLLVTSCSCTFNLTIKIYNRMLSNLFDVVISDKQLS